MKTKIGTKIIESLCPKLKPYEIRDSELKGFGVRVQPSGISTYFCDYRLIDGRRNRVTIGRTNVLTPSQARDEARIILGDVSKGIDPNKALKAAHQVTLDFFLRSKYEPWAIANRKTGQETVQRIRFSFPELLNHTLPEITPWIIEKWRTEKIKSGANKSTVNRNLAMLKASLSKAVEWGEIEVHPISRVKLSKIDGNKKVRFLSDEERTRLFLALDNRENLKRAGRVRGNQWRLVRGYELKVDLGEVRFADYLKPMVILSLNTGLRQGEVFSLRWQDIDWRQKTLTIHGAYAKSGKTRSVPLNNMAFEILFNWQKQSPPGVALIFPGADGSALNNIRRAWLNLLNNAGITNFRWHDMRHDFASQLVMNGVDLNTVRDLLGHADIKMTLVYAHLSPKTKMDAVKKLDTIWTQFIKTDNSSGYSA